MTFEEKLSKLEELTAKIKSPDISIEDALQNFEEGINLADSMKSEIDKIEGKIQKLMNQPQKSSSDALNPEIQPELGLFQADLSNTSGAPDSGLRQF